MGDDEAVFVLLWFWGFLLYLLPSGLDGRECEAIDFFLFD